MNVRAKRSLPFVQIADKTIYDKSISPTARLLLIAMLCKPDDWCFSMSGIAKELGLNEDTARKYMNELILNGYVERQKVKSKTTGRFIGWAYSVYECKDPDDWAEKL